jgi:hypothetical protein
MADIIINKDDEGTDAMSQNGVSSLRLSLLRFEFVNQETVRVEVVWVWGYYFLCHLQSTQCFIELK